jgi:hypothetical protein
MEKTYALLAAGSSTDFVSTKLNELTEKQIVLKARLASKEAEQEKFNARDSRFYSSREDIKSLVRELQKPTTDELYKLRAQIASRLKVLVETLLIAPLGEQPKMKRTIDQLVEISGAKTDEVVTHLQQLAMHPDQSRRYFAIGFRDAAVRIVFPTYSDPLRYEQQVVAGGLPPDSEQDLGRLIYFETQKPQG